MAGPPGGGLSTAAALALIFAMLGSGAINTLTKKWQMQTCADGLGGAVSPEDKDACPDGGRPFKKPWYLP